jgi:hypothetical protein
MVARAFTHLCRWRLELVAKPVIVTTVSVQCEYVRCSLLRVSSVCMECSVKARPLCIQADQWKYLSESWRQV